jgi:hypothetical protein
VSIGRKNNRAWVTKSLLALLAPAIGAGAAVAVAAAGSSTELGGTSTAFAVSVNSPMVQFSTTPGTVSYTAPDGVLTSWRYHSGSVGGTLRLMLFKPGTAPHVYEAVAASGTKNIAANTGNDFKERIPVKQGYVLGVADQTVGNIGMTTVSSSDVMDGLPAGVQVGQTVTATGPFAAREAVAATVESDADGDGFGDVSQDQCPTQKATHDACSNKFSFGKLKRKRTKGTATLPVTVPGPGTLSVSGKGVVKQRSPWAASASLDRVVSEAGTVKLLIKAKGKAKRKLTRTGKVKMKVRVTYTPADGTPNSKTSKVKLKKKLGA